MNEALKQLDALLQNAAAGPKPFPPNSRYNGVPVLTYTTADGRMLSYLARRFVPAPERFTTLATHTVAQGDRLDNLAARYLGDPEQYWKLCDANGALRPAELVETPGRRLRVALPEGIRS
jgi:hypothetical protein